ncbi:MAG: tRNA adenosine(34) deaminase TadA [SAR86 cluster bacterium]|jgi:tRNA(adenine34) deaminase|nr:tRNA adenosine(34) deaminase TadA [SAR86 cluster bacterium]
MKDSTFHEDMMLLALEEANKAEILGEVPVGAIAVIQGEVIGKGHNLCINSLDPSAHAEICTLKQAAYHQKNYRLNGVNLYVTLEPCMMCAAFLVNARIDHLYFGTFDEKSGAIISQARFLEEGYLNHKVKYEGGILAKECSEILINFFSNKRS